MLDGAHWHSCVSKITFITAAADGIVAEYVYNRLNFPYTQTD